jgi:hypothetical protein
MFVRQFVSRCLILGAFCSPAMAATGASVAVTGNNVSFSVAVDTSTADIAFGSFDVALAPGASMEEQFQYTVIVTDDGLPASRQWTFCTPLAESDCGPAPTGFEQAYASIWMGRDPNSGSDNDEWITDTSAFVSFQSVTGQPGVFHGTLDYTATNTSDFMPQFTTVTILGAVFADVSAVPEPGSLAAMLAGLALLAAAGWSTRRRQAGGRR